MKARKLTWVLFALMAAPGCADAARVGTRDVHIGRASTSDHAAGATMNSIEMQQAVQRFTGGFLDELMSAVEPLAKASDATVRREALRRVLVYSSSALDIATGPLPEVNALDMVVFIRLCRGTLERHWLPDVFGEPARPLVDVFAESEAHVWELVSKVLDARRREQLGGMVTAWERDHPEQTNVEMVRFEQFSAHAGKVERELQAQAAGLLGSVKGATQTADRALLLAERGMFLAHRLPFLMRLQTRLGAQEVVSDSIGQLEDAAAEIERSGRGSELVHELTDLSQSSLGAAQQARLTLEELKPLFDKLPAPAEVRSTLVAGDALANKALLILQEARALAPEDARGTLVLLEASTNRVMRRLVMYLAVFAAGWTVLFWGGYYVVRSRLPRRRERA